MPLIKNINAIVNDFLNESYDDVSIDSIKKHKKLSDYKNYKDKIVINGNTYLNFIEDDDWFLWGYIIVFDNSDETEVANASYGKLKETSNMTAAIDVRPDKRRMGIASNIYEWIEKLTGYKLHPESKHSPSAEALWNNPKRKFGFDK